jgi:hypothetical protein
LGGTGFFVGFFTGFFVGFFTGAVTGFFVVTGTGFFVTANVCSVQTAKNARITNNFIIYSVMELYCV